MIRQNGEPSKVGSIKRCMRMLDIIMTRIEDTITISFMIIMTTAILAGVVMRFILKIPNLYGEEISRYSMIIVAFIGISAGVRQKSHLGIDGVVNSLPTSAAKVLRIIASLISTFAYGLFAFEAYMFVSHSRRMNQLSPAMRLPMWIVYSILMVGFAMSFIRSIMVFWSDYLARNGSGLLEAEENLDQNFQ